MTNVNTVVNGSLWSLPLEIGCYVFLLIFYLLCKKINCSPLIPIFLIGVLALIPHEVLCRDILGIDYSLFDSTLIICFIVGALLAIYQDKIDLDYRLIFALLLLCAFTWRYTHVICYVFPITLSMVLLLITSQSPIVGFKPRIDISYGVYIWHWPIIQIITSSLGISNPYLMFILAILLTSIISALSYIYIEKPSMKYGKKVSRIIDSKSINYNNYIVISILFFAVIILAKFIL